MSMKMVCNWLAAAVMCFAPMGAHAQERLHLDINEAIVRVPISVKDLYGKEYKAAIPVTVFRPNGAGPFPLVVINHGRGFSPEIRAKLIRARYESAARFFVRKGFTVAVPTRLGNGDQSALGDPEWMPSCSNPRFAEILEPAVDQIAAVTEYMQKQPYVDPSRLVMAGVSVGGLSAIGLSARRLSGLVAAINFAGGHGGDPEGSPGEPCQAGQLTRLMKRYGEAAAKGAPMPMLWVYSENDQFFNPKNSRMWHAAYVESGGQAEFRLLPAFGKDGHDLFSQGSDIWQPIVDEFLARYGFETTGVMERPAATNFAKLDDVDALPYAIPLSKVNYRRFLGLLKPKAFAIGDSFYHGYASGDDAMSKALAACQRQTGKPCRLYAVDDDVVWKS